MKPKKIPARLSTKRSHSRLMTRQQTRFWVGRSFFTTRIIDKPLLATVARSLPTREIWIQSVPP